jgi:hypothetical protein
MIASVAGTGSSVTGGDIALVVAPLMVVVLGARFVVSYRRNQRMSERSHGGMTASERTLSRTVAALILVVLVGSMALAVASVLSNRVRDALGAVGEQSSWLPLALAPVAVLYALWLRRMMRRAAAERASRG